MAGQHFSRFQRDCSHNLIDSLIDCCYKYKIGCEIFGKSVEYYLSKGYDRKMAEYFASGRKRITKVIPRNDFTLLLSFDNGETRLYDAGPLLQAGTVFAPFREWDNFRRVYLDEDHSVCWDIDPNIDSNDVWNNKVDLCPDSCYVDSVPFH